MKDEEFIKNHFLEIPPFYTKEEVSFRSLNIWEIIKRCIIGLWCGYWGPRTKRISSRILLSKNPLPGYIKHPAFGEVSHIYIPCGPALNRQLIEYQYDFE